MSTAESLWKIPSKAADQVLCADTGTQFILSGTCGCELQLMALPEEFQGGNTTNSPSIHTKSFVCSFTAITISN